MAPATEIEYTRPWLYPKQLEALFCEERYGIVEACTKTGKTVGCLAWIFEIALLTGAGGRNYWWVAPVYTQADIAFRRLKRMLPEGLCKFTEAPMTAELPNGSVIWFKSAEKPDNLFGEDVYAAVVDEATRVRKESWYALRTTLSHTRGPLRIIGNVKGRRNWAYKLARKAEGGLLSNSHYAKLVAADAVEAGVLSAEEVEDAKEKLPEAVFAELYLAEPASDEGCPFKDLDVRACTVLTLSELPPVVWGWDLAKSVDWTVGVALDALGDVCRLHRFQAPWGLTKARIWSETGFAPAWVDATGVGDPVVEDLQQRSGTRFYGFKFHQQSKQQLLEGLVVDIEQAKVHFPEGRIPQELLLFEYEYTRTGVRYAISSEDQDEDADTHDDAAIALALARHGYRTGHFERPRGTTIIRPKPLRRAA